MGSYGPDHATRADAVLHRLPEARRAVRRLGRRLSARVDEPECTTQARPAGDAAVVDAGRTFPLRSCDGAAVRCGEPTAAWDEQVGERGQQQRPQQVALAW